MTIAEDHIEVEEGEGTIGEGENVLKLIVSIITQLLLSIFFCIWSELGSLRPMNS